MRGFRPALLCFDQFAVLFVKSTCRQNTAMPINETNWTPLGGGGLNPPTATKDDALRRRAEAIELHEHVQLSDQTEHSWPAAAQQALYELRVHQIELELQNEEVRSAHAELDIQRSRYFDIYDNAPVGYCLVNDRELVEEANLTLANMLGVTRSDLIKQPFFRYLQQDDRHVFHQMCQQLLVSGETQDCELQLARRDGVHVVVHLTATPAQDDRYGSVMRVALTNVTERKKIEQELKTVEERFRLLFDRATDGILILSEWGELLAVNDAFAKMHGYTKAEMVSLHLRDLDAPEALQEVPARLERILAGEALTFETKHNHKDGRVLVLEVSSSLISGNGERLVQAFHRDISDRKRSEELVRELAYYDPLTGLANRMLLKDRLTQSMLSGQRSCNYGALMFLDLDNFKPLNDQHGHSVGDLLLAEVAKRLKSCVRQIDTVARFGGDEFIVLLDDLTGDKGQAHCQAEQVAEKVRKLLADPYLMETVASEDGAPPHNVQHHGSASIGVTLFLGQEITQEDILIAADMAMYRAKDVGGNTVCFFDEQMRLEKTGKSVLREDLRNGVIEQQFYVHYQAQLLGVDQITGVEALVRWQHPTRGWVFPMEFIATTEKTGLILPLGLWVLETACTQLSLWSRQPKTARLTMAVNVSARQFHHGNFVDQVLAVLERTGANPKQLTLELTESVLVTDVEDVIAKMELLKAKGIRFSLDDFGTGYSSLAYLKRLPLDQLKIAQAFVRDILIDPDDAVIAKTVIVLANSLGLSVIAEGVETEAQRDLLAGMGCHNYQGYLFSQALPAHEFEALVKK